jgi:hypothetical protein
MLKEFLQQPKKVSGNFPEVIESISSQSYQFFPEMAQCWHEDFATSQRHVDPY